MLVKIFVQTNETYDPIRDEFISDGTYAEVDVPYEDIVEIIANQYKIPVQTMRRIIVDFDIDLTDELKYNEEIIEHAEALYEQNNT